MSTGVVPGIELQMTLLLFFALAGYLLASKINQSAVVGEILLGLVVGPSVLGLITYTEFVQAIAALGAVILMFVIGFEFKIEDLTNVKYGIIGLIGIIVPWIGGYFVSLAFGFSPESALFIGTALTATSIAITANVLKEMCLLDAEFSKAIIGTAVIDDILSLLALSITADVASGTFSFGGLAFIIAKQIGFLVLIALIGVFFISKMIVRMDESPISKKYPEFVFIFAVMIAFLFAALAEFIGISAIIGAFIAGVSFNGINLKHSHDISEGADYLYIIFASVFFVSLGILVDLSALTGPVLIFIAVITVIAIISKVVGCGIPARLLGYSNRDSLAIGFGMSPRGEVAMIVALMGLNLSLIGQDIYASIVVMSILTTVITPIAFRNWLFKKEVKACIAGEQGMQ
ncbi:sodium/hydrogen exchanger [Methanolacinia petrolearia DSM 11571]|uniref:Sodium/hydrogen exchanger n=1 Tax=Methanolacinia petrolearia (strain DSM 11571 / OCM 486 / SEBR 4847) TaxID=679926 RepID=E1RE08_METP4|nr:cation:proton antiporter [Methanolacinia petrolearia]ADN34899.1 sodium/hydrogen exchanger [Methanolacinia petrolearia DSM 11571]